MSRPGRTMADENKGSRGDGRDRTPRAGGGRSGGGRSGGGKPGAGKPGAARGGTRGGAGRPERAPRPAARAGARSGEARAGAPRDADARPRHDDPVIPDDVTANQLDRTSRAELKTLSKDNADWVAKHLVMAGRLIDEDP